MNFKICVLSLLVTGCGGSSFSALTEDQDAAAPDTEADADAGGAPGVGGNLGAGGGTAVRVGGSPGAGGVAADACTLVTHSNGLGQTWQDCVPLNTFDKAQAMKACKASGAAVCLENERCGPTVYAVQGFNADRSHLIGEWGYGDFAAGYVSPNYALCAPSDPARRVWT